MSWSGFTLFVVVGYLTMSRSFAYLGLPPARLFIGEIFIGAFLFTRPRAVVDRLLAGIAYPSPLSGYSLALSVSLAYGLFEVVHGWLQHYSPVIIIESFAFNYYPVCFFIGIAIGRLNSRLLPRIVRVLAWVNGVYGILFIAVLNRVPFGIPGVADVGLFGQPAGAGVAILGLLCFEPRLSRVWHLLVINFAVLLGLLVRAEYLGFTLALLVWAAMTRQFGRLFVAVASVAALFAAALVTDFRIPAPATRGGEISASAIVGRVLSPASTDLAANYTRDKDARSEAGTAEWRTRWWHAIWDTVNQTTETAVFGEGYGYPIAKLVGYTEREIRTPHSVFFYALAYGGWVGVALFFALQASLVHVLWRAWLATGNAFGLVFWTYSFAGAFFGNLFETPFGAIPLYLLTGLAASALVGGVRAWEPRYMEMQTNLYPVR